MDKSVKIKKFVIVCGMTLVILFHKGRLNVIHALSEPYYDSLKVFRTNLEYTDSICGVIYLGEVDRNIDSLTDDRAYLEALLYSSSNAEFYDFLWNIPNDLVIENDSGTELYCIVPADENEQEYADTIVETISLWEVVNCNEWVSLREKPDVNSTRLAEVPLGTFVTDLGEYENGFTYVNFDGIEGDIHDDYLMYYMGGDYADPCEGDIYYEEGLEPAATYPLFMTYDEIVSWGYEVLNFVNGKFTVYAAMDNEIDGEILWRNDPGNPDIKKGLAIASPYSSANISSTISIALS